MKNNKNDMCEADEILHETEDESKIYKLTKPEREVVLNIDDDTKRWSAYVTSPGWMKKFEKAGWECVKVDHYANGEVVAKYYEAPAKCITITKERKKRELSEDELLKLQNRVKMMQKAKQDKKEK